MNELSLQTHFSCSCILGSKNHLHNVRLSTDHKTSGSNPFCYISNDLPPYCVSQNITSKLCYIFFHVFQQGKKHHFDYFEDEMGTGKKIKMLLATDKLITK